MCLHTVYASVSACVSPRAHSTFHISLSTKRPVSFFHKCTLLSDRITSLHREFVSLCSLNRTIPALASTITNSCL